MWARRLGIFCQAAALFSIAPMSAICRKGAIAHLMGDLIWIATPV